MTLEGYLGAWALVTGAGDGIGLALATGLATAGMKVLAADIRADAADAVAASINASSGTAQALCVDVSDRVALDAAAAALAIQGVQPRLVWANAGVGAAVTIADGSVRTLDWLMQVNVFGVIHTVQAFLPGLRAARAEGLAAHVGVTASSAALVDVAAPFTAYAATKHAAAAMGEALAADLAPAGIGVTLLYPPMLDTGIWNAARARPERFGGVRALPHDVGAPWRETPPAAVVVGPALATVAAGGGRCVLDSRNEPAVRAARASAIEAAAQRVI